MNFQTYESNFVNVLRYIMNYEKYATRYMIEIKHSKYEILVSQTAVGGRFTLMGKNETL